MTEKKEPEAQPQKPEEKPKEPQPQKKVDPKYTVKDVEKLVGYVEEFMTVIEHPDFHAVFQSAWNHGVKYEGPRVNTDDVKAFLKELKER